MADRAGKTISELLQLREAGFSDTFSFILDEEWGDYVRTFETMVEARHEEPDRSPRPRKPVRTKTVRDYSREDLLEYMGIDPAIEQAKKVIATNIPADMWEEVAELFEAESEPKPATWATVPFEANGLTTGPF